MALPTEDAEERWGHSTSASATSGSQTDAPQRRAGRCAAALLHWLAEWRVGRLEQQRSSGELCLSLSVPAVCVG